MDIEKLRQIACDNMAERRSHDFKERGNKYYHGQRVAKLALTLRPRVTDDASKDELISASAFFHDICNGQPEHGTRGAEATRELIKDACSPEDCDAIFAIVGAHDKRVPGGGDYDFATKLVQDADILDHYGVYSIWMEFVYAIHNDKTLDGVRDYMLNVWPQVYQKDLGRLNYDVSRAILDEKAEFGDAFAARFAKEINGELIE